MVSGKEKNFTDGARVYLQDCPIHLCAVYKAIWNRVVANADVCVSHVDIRSSLARMRASAQVLRRTQALAKVYIIGRI